MRILILLVTLTISMIHCNGQVGEMNNRKTLLEEFNLRGHVKTVAYEYDGKSHVLHFDEAGYLIKQENNHPWGGVRQEIYDNYSYDENNKLKSFDIFRVFDKIPTLLIGKAVFEYDQRGLLISSQFLNDTTIYKYDKRGNRTESYAT